MEGHNPYLLAAAAVRKLSLFSEVALHFGLKTLAATSSLEKKYFSFFKSGSVLNSSYDTNS